MMADKYTNYEALRQGEREGVAFRIRILRRDSKIAVIAPHGGKIEPGTSEIAEAIAGADMNLYCLEGLKDRDNGDLHVTSANFDEPGCMELVRGCDYVLAVHGKAGETQHVEVGGLDEGLRDAICKALVETKFSAGIIISGALAGLSATNICNRGVRKVGVQLEITRSLRDAMRANKALLARFAAAVRSALAEQAA